ncbi:MAG: hypothetical protein IPI46_12320 [Bacteroidetes bacterium]|nr:hypothetical protein [Bacteroidota bacterium]
MSQYHIKIEGISNPNKFIDDWSVTYKMKGEEKYIDNIEDGFQSDKSLKKLLEWKNGTGDRISDNKMKLVNDFLSKRNTLNTLKINFNFNEFEKQFNPQKSSSIWKIFLLHIIDPANHPIFDQHVYRSFKFFQTGKVEYELPKDKHKEVYRIYKEEYLPWFNELKLKYNLEPRKIDKSLFSFGQVLKRLQNLPITTFN